MTDLTERLAATESQRATVAERVEHADDTSRSVVAHWRRIGPGDATEAFTLLVEARAELATLEERIRETAARHGRASDHLDAMRAVQRGLADLAAAADVSAVDGAARFRSASRQVFHLIEDERTRIARDMHDGPAQSLANLVLQAEVLERLADREPHTLMSELEGFKTGVRTALEETRRLIFDLRPMTLDDLGLVPTLRRLVKDFGDRTGMASRFQLVGKERRLPQGYEAVLFRVVQEALTNVRKHAHARAVDVILTMQPRRVSAIVKDDGEGFDVPATEARQGRTRHLGLISMRERADLEQGDFEVRSQLGRGTEVRVAFAC